MICLLLVFFLAPVFAINGAGLAWASCIYNKTHYPLSVNLHCGAACRNNWTIHVDDHKCRPGRGGTVWVRVMDPFNDHEIDNGVCELKVDDHGWVTVYQDGKKITVKSKHKDGSLRHECTTRITKD